MLQVDVLDRYGSLSDPVFRALFSLIFLVAGVGHFAQQDVMLARLDAAPLGSLARIFGPPELLMSLSGVVLILGGLALAVGWRTRMAAAALILTLIPITVTVHVGDADHVGPFFKNVALLGGLLHFGIRGAGAYSIERARGRG
jgi:putative oxidoreductase